MNSDNPIDPRYTVTHAELTDAGFTLVDSKKGAYCRTTQYDFLELVLDGGLISVYSVDGFGNNRRGLTTFTSIEPFTQWLDLMDNG